MNAGAMWAAWNLIRTGNVLGIRHDEFEEEKMGFGSTTEDHDGVPKDIDRGPPEEMRMTEAELRGQMQTIADAKMSMGEQAMLKGVIEEMKILRSLVDDVCNQNNSLVNMVGNLRTELAQFKQQWNVERMSWIARNGGSTTPEDN